MPLFVMVCGGRGRTLLSFKCVYSGCSAFVDVRTILHADVIKCVLMCVPHNHAFSVFPSRIPRNTFTDKTKASIRKMVLENRRCGEIRMRNDVLCNKVIDLDGALERPNSSARGVFLWRRLGNQPSRKRPIIGQLIVLCSCCENKGRLFFNYDRTFLKCHEKAEKLNLENRLEEQPTKKKDVIECSVLNMKTMRRSRKKSWNLKGVTKGVKSCKRC